VTFLIIAPYKYSYFLTYFLILYRLRDKARYWRRKSQFFSYPLRPGRNIVIPFGKEQLALLSHYSITKRLAQSFIVSYVGYTFITEYN